jgi:glutathione S-transferase
MRALPKLHGFLLCPYAARVELALAHKGVAYEAVRVPEGDAAERQRLSPVGGKLPVLEHDGHRLRESAVIVQYVDETWPHDGLLLGGYSPWERAEQRAAVHFCNTQLALVIFRAARAAPSAPSADARVEDDDAAAVRRDLSHALQQLERLLAPHAGPFFLADRVAFADVMFAPFLEILGVLAEVRPDLLPPAALAGHRRVAGWLAAVLAAPSFATIDRRALLRSTYGRPLTHLRWHP